MLTKSTSGTSLRKRIRNYLVLYSLVIIAVPVLLADYLGEMYEDHRLRSIVAREFVTFRQSTAFRENKAATKQGKLRFYIWQKSQDVPAAIPSNISKLGLGEHNDIEVGGHEYFVIVKDFGNRRVYMRYNKTDFEDPENELLLYGILFFTLVFLAAVYMSHLLARRFTQPVSALASQINTLNPECRGLQIDYSQQESELQAISKVVNGYLQRLDAYVDREMEFLDTASHELRTPITIVKGAVEVLKDNPKLKDMDLPALSRIENAAFNMLSMVEALLFLAKDPNHIDSLFEPVNLNKLIKDCLDDSKYVANRSDIPYKLTLDNSTILAPKFLSKIVVSNLIRNAINYTSRGSIEITLQQHVLTIANEGDPINTESEISVFEKRVRGTNNNNSSGTGLGLYIIKKICLQLAWKIELTSDAQNRTVMTLVFNRIVQDGST